MRKKFLEAEMEIIKFQAEDIITTSGLIEENEEDNGVIEGQP